MTMLYGRGALEPFGVDEHVEEIAGQGERGGHPVDRQPEQQHRGDREGDAERERRVRG